MCPNSFLILLHSLLERFRVRCTHFHLQDDRLRLTNDGMMVAYPRPRNAIYQLQPHVNGRPILLSTILTLLLLLLLPNSLADSNISSFRTRDFQTLDDVALKYLVDLNPPEWASVTGGHLGEILIPRAGERPLPLRFISFADVQL